MVKCDFCGEKEGNKSCSICKHAIYCSLNCQKSHWSKHKKRKRSKRLINIYMNIICSHYDKKNIILHTYVQKRWGYISKFRRIQFTYIAIIINNN